jgi:hypothetical protein
MQAIIKIDEQHISCRAIFPFNAPPIRLAGPGGSIMLQPSKLSAANIQIDLDGFYILPSEFNLEINGQIFSFNTIEQKGAAVWGVAKKL